MINYFIIYVMPVLLNIGIGFFRVAHINICIMTMELCKSSLFG